MQLRSFRCHCPAIHFSSMPSLYYSGLRHATATQYDSLQYNSFPFIAIADQIDAPLTYALASQRASYHRHAVALHFYTLTLLIRASPHHSLLRHCDSMLVSAIALPLCTDLCIAMPLLFISKHCISLPSHYISMLFAAVASRLFPNHHPAIAKRFLTSLYLSYAFYLLAMPLPRNTVASLRVLYSAMAFLCSADHYAAIAMQR